MQQAHGSHDLYCYAQIHTENWHKCLEETQTITKMESEILQSIQHKPYRWHFRIRKKKDLTELRLWPLNKLILNTIRLKNHSAQAEAYLQIPWKPRWNHLRKENRRRKVPNKLKPNSKEEGEILNYVQVPSIQSKTKHENKKIKIKRETRNWKFSPGKEEKRLKKINSPEESEKWK